MKIDFVTIVLSVGIFQGIFLTIFLLFSNEAAGKSNKILACFIFSFTLLTLNDLLVETKALLDFPNLFLLLDPLIFVLGPLAYFYIRDLVMGQKALRLKDLFHFLPAAFLWIILIPIYLQSTTSKENLILESYSTLGEDTDFILIFAALHLLVYFIISIAGITKYQQEIKENYSFEEKINLKWLKYFLIITSVLWIFFTIQVLFQFNQLKSINDLLFTISMYLIGYYGLLRSPIKIDVKDKTPTIKERPSKFDSRKKYASSPLTEENSNRILIKLKHEMVEKKYYLKNDLKLSELSEYIKIPSYQISQVINEKLNKNFFDFINDYRVEEFKHRLADDKFNNYTILAIGLDSGFNSKASFNSVFKKSTGITPSVYRDKLLTEESI